MSKQKSSTPDYRVNDRIEGDVVRLVMGDGEHIGIVPLEEARTRAEEEGLDLVEIAADADPPVCKVLDYGKFKYRQQKRRQKQKKHKSELKEIRIGISTEEHDLNFKADRVIEFLKNHNKVLISMNLSGREKVHGKQAMEHMYDFADRFEEVGKIEREPTRESAGRITMLLCPR
ncbi:MAG: translation initiation factor IF-3 [Candidatus Brocadiia bacterium]